MNKKQFFKLYTGIIFFVCLTIMFLLYKLNFKSSILELRTSRIKLKYNRNILTKGKKELHNTKQYRIKSKKFDKKSSLQRNTVSAGKHVSTFKISNRKLSPTVKISTSKLNLLDTLNITPSISYKTSLVNVSLVPKSSNIQKNNLENQKNNIEQEFSSETKLLSKNFSLISLENKMYPDLHTCLTKPFQSNYVRNGDYWILNDYIPAGKHFRCNESVTFTTHSEYTYLNNLLILSYRWKGPISVAVYAPGEDFSSSVKTILWLRECGSEDLKKYVTFHMIFHLNHRPTKVSSTEDLLKMKVKCYDVSTAITNATTYRAEKNLTYPINIARNTAKTNAKTYFNFPADIELYPSINFIPEFLKMLKKPDVSNSTNDRVYVFPIFEVSADESPPETKRELLKLLKKEKAVSFHKYVCPKCHSQPEGGRWMKTEMTEGLSVFHIAKRRRPFHKWEPIYVGTQREPLYDNTLSWEGRKDKMTQMYILCVRNYEFHILDNAFLVHSPGIRTEATTGTLHHVAKQKQFLHEFINLNMRFYLGREKAA